VKNAGQSVDGLGIRAEILGRLCILDALYQRERDPQRSMGKIAKEYTSNPGIGS